MESISASSGQRPARRPTPTGELREGSRVRLDVLETRAKRARRRLILTLTLLAITAAVWTTVGFAMWPWWAGLTPTLLLGTVLALGRAASAADRKTNARWAAQRRAAARAAASERALASGGPQTPQNHVVIGELTEALEQPEERVVGGPTGYMTSRYVNRGRTAVPTRTGAIAPVADESAPLSSIGAGASGVIALDAPAVEVVELTETAEAAEIAAKIVEVAEISEAAAEVSISVPAEMPKVAAYAPVITDVDDAVAAAFSRPAEFAAETATPAVAFDVPVEVPVSVLAWDSAQPVVKPWAPRPVPLSAQAEADSGLGKAWAPKDMPLPTYVGKAPAPQRELRPISAMYPTVADAVAAMLDPNADGAAHPHSGSLGIPLDQILARRRAS